MGHTFLFLCTYTIFFENWAFKIMWQLWKLDSLSFSKFIVVPVCFVYLFSDFSELIMEEWYSVSYVATEVPPQLTS